MFLAPPKGTRASTPLPQPKEEVLFSRDIKTESPDSETPGMAGIECEALDWQHLT